MSDDELRGGTSSEGRGGLRATPQLVAGVVLAGGLLAFVFQNTREEKVSWLVFDVTAPLWIVLFVTAAVAIAVGELVGAALRRRRRKHK